MTNPGTDPRGAQTWMAGTVLVFGLIFAGIGLTTFLQTGQPILLFFVAIGLVIGVGQFMAIRKGGLPWMRGPWWGAPPQVLVQIRCRACGALNPENARYCNQCGKAP